MMYRVRWEIDLDANSTEEAAKKALAIQRDPESIGTVFDVSWTPEWKPTKNARRGKAKTVRVDLG
jgi:hypothetical protein